MAEDDGGESLILQLQAAREYALLGNYETALIYFEGVTKAVNQTLRATPVAEERQTWTRVSPINFASPSKLHPACRLKPTSSLKLNL
jgi:hypothetical protein